MTLTRANVETILIRRAGKLLTEAGLDGSTDDGTNADLNDPIGWAVRQAEGTVSDVVAVADTDVATVANANIDQFLDLAEFRTLENISGNLAVVDIKSGPFSENYDQLVDRIEKRLARKRKQLETDYGFGLGTLEAGVIGLDFMQKNESNT